LGAGAGLQKSTGHFYDPARTPHVPKDSPAGRRHFARCLEGRRRQESPKADWRAVERGWFVGDKQLKAELLARMHERWRDHNGPELREADQAHAERVLREELSRRGWTEDELSRRRKGDPEKVEVAALLRARTTMTLKRIARRLKMGTWTYVSNCLAEQRRKGRKV
jgi:hypothetical protein